VVVEGVAVEARELNNLTTATKQLSANKWERIAYNGSKRTRTAST
jgi:hypothetical protein